MKKKGGGDAERFAYLLVAILEQRSGREQIDSVKGDLHTDCAIARGARERGERRDEAH